jgi:hypothetical protein
MLGALIGVGTAWMLASRSYAHSPLVASQTSGLYPYSFNDARCTSVGDPINMVILGSSADDDLPSVRIRADRLARDVAAAGWTYTFDSKPHHFFAGGCYRQAGSHATGDFVSTRYHLRYLVLRGVSPWGDEGEYALATPHFEHSAHVATRVLGLLPVRKICHPVPVGGFQKAQAELLRQLSALQDDGRRYRRVRTEYWDNTIISRQCTGALSGGDGYVEIIRMEHTTD